MPDAPGLLERLDAGPVICAEGYLFELERRGYGRNGSAKAASCDLDAAKRL